MAVRFIDSFDLWATPGATDLHDWAPYWAEFGGTITVHDGYLTGQALQPGAGTAQGFPGTGAFANDLSVGQAEARMCVWIYSGPYYTEGEWGGIMYFDWPGSGALKAGLQGHGDGSGRLCLEGFYDEGDSTSFSSTVTLPTGWNCYELYFNRSTKLMTLTINGVLTLSGTIPVTTIPDGVTPNPFLNRPKAGATNFPLPLIFDHVIITDGERLTGDTIHCLAPSLSFEGYEAGNSAGFKGALVIDGVTYRSELAETSASSTLAAWGIGENVSTNHYFPFPTNPATNGAWTADALSTITAWGVCSVDTNGEDSLRATSLGLTVVETMTDPNNLPIIKTYPPEKLAFFSGPWVKTSSSKGMAAHLNDIPRTVELGDYLTINNDGCLLFEPPSLIEGADRPFTGVGITFAEEFRIDYKDWVAVTGGEDYKSYFTSGYSVLNQSDKKFQSNYVSVQYENSSPIGGAYLQGVWDYSLDPTTGRWSTKQQVYNPRDIDKYKHETRRLKVRGHGTALQIRVDSESGKNFMINGWAIQVTGNTAV